MKVRMIFFLGMLVCCVPLASGAESAPMDSAGGSRASQNPFSVTFKPSSELFSKPSAAALGKGASETGTALPFLVTMPKPIMYPGWARRKGSEGLLVVALEVLENGNVGRWQILKSTGEESLDKAASRAFSTWKFQPAMKNGKPVRTCIQVPINFELTPK